MSSAASLEIECAFIMTATIDVTTRLTFLRLFLHFLLLRRGSSHSSRIDRHHEARLSQLVARERARAQNRKEDKNATRRDATRSACRRLWRVIRARKFARHSRRNRAFRNAGERVILGSSRPRYTDPSIRSRASRS